MALEFIKKLTKKIKPNKKDPLVVSHRCGFLYRNKQTCKGTIYENKKLDFQLKGECDRPCEFKAKFFAMVYIPDEYAKKSGQDA